MILDGPTLRSTRESGHRAGYDGHKKKRGSKVHVAVDTLGSLLDVVISKGGIPNNREQGRAQVAELIKPLQKTTHGTVFNLKVEVAFVDQGYTEKPAASAAAKNDVELIVVKHHQAKRGFVLLPRRWVVERP